MATKIQSPLEEYTGTDTFGPLTLDFKDGEAVTEEKLSDGHKLYFKRHGFKISTVRAETTDAPKGDAPKDAPKTEKDGDAS